MASWNVEGLTDPKMFELSRFMRRRGVGIISIQETHISYSLYFTTEDGFFLILSGSAGREHAGVGFIVAPWVKASLVGFLQMSNRLACLKLRVSGGQIAILSAYAPHSGHPHDERQYFHQELGQLYGRTSVNGMKLILGDLNAGVGSALAGEDVYIGKHTFGATRSHFGSNRDLLLELCAARHLVVANTCFDVPASQRATCRRVGVKTQEAVSLATHLQLDFCLVAQSSMNKIELIQSDPSEPLASHHFVLLASLNVEVEKQVRRQPPDRHDRQALETNAVAGEFVERFAEHLKTRCLDTSNVDTFSSCISDAFHFAETSVYYLSSFRDAGSLASVTSRFP